MSWRDALRAASQTEPEDVPEDLDLHAVANEINPGGYDTFTLFNRKWIPIVTDQTRSHALFPEHAEYERALCAQAWGESMKRPAALVRFLQYRAEHLLKFVCPVPPRDTKKALQYLRCAFRWTVMYSMNVLEGPAQPETEKELDAFRQKVLMKILEPGARARLRRATRGVLASRAAVMGLWAPMREEATGKDMATLLRLFPPTVEETDAAPFLFQTFQMPALAVTQMLDAVVGTKRLFRITGEREDEVRIDTKLYPGMIVDNSGLVYMMNDAGTAFEELNGKAVIPFLADRSGNARLVMASVINRQILDKAYTAYARGIDARSDDLSAPHSIEDLRSQMEEEEEDHRVVEERSGTPTDTEEEEKKAMGAAVAPMEVEPRGPVVVKSEARAPGQGKRVAEAIVISSDDEDTASESGSIDGGSVRRSPLPAAVSAPAAAVPGAVPVPDVAVPAAAAAPKKERAPKKLKPTDYDIITVKHWRPVARGVAHVPGSAWRAKWDDIQRNKEWQAVDYALHFNVPGDLAFPRLLEYESDQIPYGRTSGKVAELTERVFRWLEQLLPAYPTWVDESTGQRRTTEECIAVFEAMLDWVLLEEHNFIPAGELLHAIVRDAMRRQVLNEMKPSLLSNLRRGPDEPWEGRHIDTEDFARRYDALWNLVPKNGTLPEIANVVTELPVDDTGQIDLFEQMSLRMAVVERILMTKLTKGHELPVLLAFERANLDREDLSVPDDTFEKNVGKGIVIMGRYTYPAGILEVTQTAGKHKVQSFLLMPDLVKRGQRIPGRTSFFHSKSDSFIVFFHDRDDLYPRSHLNVAVDKNCKILDAWMFINGPNRNRPRRPMPAATEPWQQERIVERGKGPPEEEEEEEEEDDEDKEDDEPDVPAQVDPEAEALQELNVRAARDKKRGFGFTGSGKRVFDFGASEAKARAEAKAKAKAKAQGAAASAPPPAAAAAATPTMVHVATVKRKPKERTEEEHRDFIERDLGLK